MRRSLMKNGSKVSGGLWVSKARCSMRKCLTVRFATSTFLRASRSSTRSSSCYFISTEMPGIRDSNRSGFSRDIGCISTAQLSWPMCPRKMVKQTLQWTIPRCLRWAWGVIARQTKISGCACLTRTANRIGAKPSRSNSYLSTRKERRFVCVAVVTEQNRALSRPAKPARRPI